MRQDLHERRRRLRKYGVTTTALLTVLTVVLVFTVSAAAKQGSTASAQAACATASHLPNSKFEVDDIIPPASGSKKNAAPTGGANLKVDGSTADCIDWLNSTNTGLRSGGFYFDDTASGANDDAFGQGTAENDPVPTVVKGSIPPNKSDLSHFGIYKETAGTQSFLGVYWIRVQNPSGTTNMDFEFNKNKCDASDLTNSVCSSNGITPVRSDGDKLLLYDLSSGGTHVTISIRTWNSGAWGPEVDLDATTALGSANYDAIATADDGPFSGLSSLTFGEATIDLNALLGGTCGKFGSVYLKSRSSTSFTSEIKDFIAPKAVSISNCATISTTASNNTAATAQTIGSSISDTATVSNLTSTAGGTVTFKLYGPFDPTDTSADSCTGTPAFDDSLTPKAISAVVNGSATATESFTPTATGRYIWVTHYSGDANNSSADSVGCPDTGETSFVVKASSSITTAQKLVPNDSATIGGGGTLDGTVAFKLFAPNNATCATGASDPAAVSLTGTTSFVLSASSPQTKATNNTTDTDTLAGSHASALGTWHWLVTYSGDSTHNNSSSACIEAFSIDDDVTSP
jgi:hypothetical protein